MIRELTRPIGEVARLIQQNIQLAEKFKQNDLNDLVLLEPKKLPQKVGKIITFDYPWTICIFFGINSSNITSSLAAIDKHISDLHDEQSQIIGICNEFSKFIKQNSLTPYNDDILAYIRYFIREEEMKKLSKAYKNLSKNTKTNKNIIKIHRMMKHHLKLTLNQKIYLI